MTRNSLFVAGAACFILGALVGGVVVRSMTGSDRPGARMLQPQADLPADPFLQAEAIGNRAMDGKRYDEALAAYDRALAIRFDADVATDRGVCFRMTGDRQRALTAFDFVLMKEPAHWQARYNKAVVQLELGRVADARETAAALMREKPEDSTVKALSKAIEEASATPARR